MIIKNLSKQTILSKEAKYALSLIDKSLGLLLSSNPKTLVFRTRFGIHTLGLKNSIDIIVLGSDLKVITIKQGLKPNRFFFWNPFYSLVIEFPSGTINQSKTAVDDLISIN